MKHNQLVHSLAMAADCPVVARALEERVKQYGIHDLRPLLTSSQFTEAGFSLDANSEKIVRAY